MTPPHPCTCWKVWLWHETPTRQLFYFDHNYSRPLRRLHGDSNIAGSRKLSAGHPVYLWWVLSELVHILEHVPHLLMSRIYSCPTFTSRWTTRTGTFFQWHHDRKLCTTSEFSLLDNLIHMLLHSADGSITRNVSRRNFLLRSLWPLDCVFSYFFFFIFLYSAIRSNFHLISPC